MKWVLIIAAMVAALAVAVVIVGALLPRDHVVGLSARVAAAPDTVWAAITDAAAQSAWRPDVERIELLPPENGRRAWREHLTSGTIAMVADAEEPPRHLVTRIADPSLPFGGTWDYRIEPDGAGASRVTIVERGSVRNPVFRFVSRFVMGHTATLDTYLRALGRKFGDEPTPAVVAMTATEGR